MIHPIDQYEQFYSEQKIIGRGQYGIVYLVKHKKSGLDYAAKKTTGEYSLNELEILLRLNHPNIIRVFECFKSEKNLILIMEYCEKGDLWNLIQYRLLEGKNRGFAQKIVEQWFVQLLMGLAYIHDQKIIHRDLKSMNILIKSDGQLKISDFGVAKVLRENQMATTMAGSPFYLSPEISQGMEYSFSSDMWSLGCIIFELCTLKHAFDGKELNQVISNIQNCKLQSEILIEDQANQNSILMADQDIRFYSSDLVQMINSLLSLEANKRPSAQNLLKTPFIAKIMLRSFEKRQSQSVPDMQKMGQVTFVQKKAQERYKKQITYVKHLLGNSQDSVNAQSQVIKSQGDLNLQKQASAGS
uniref:non-specific serine/threonine protein kinase n=1 Tax=Paramecium caudatum TaxID=5885 RepID=Q8N0P1_PARCA|nr:serine/threonine protein kinase 2 homolog [Paramecium caudatum]BAC23148.1 serine/threonine protein kinase 2 homolog [Paramecium caudatum]